MTEAARPQYFRRLWRELGRIGGEHDAFIKVIIVERLAKALVLLVLGVGLLVAGRKGWLDAWAQYAEDQLNLGVGRSVIMQILLKALVYIGAFTHITLLAVSATGILIPYEAYEVIRRPTFFKVGALFLNLAVVGYLAYRKRLFVGV